MEWGSLFELFGLLFWTILTYAGDHDPKAMKNICIEEKSYTLVSEQPDPDYKKWIEKQYLVSCQLKKKPLDLDER